MIRDLLAELKLPTKSPYEIAAWAHMQYVQIHPHVDGNGKTGRLLLNMILAHFDQMPLVFPSDNEYTHAIESEIVTPGSFIQYVKEVVIPWNEKNARYFEENPLQVM